MITPSQPVGGRVNPSSRIAILSIRRVPARACRSERPHGRSRDTQPCSGEQHRERRPSRSGTHHNHVPHRILPPNSQKMPTTVDINATTSRLIVNARWPTLVDMSEVSAPRRSDATRARILRAARAEFAAVGYQRATIRGIAAGADIDPSLVMRYFGSKAELFDAIVRSTCGCPISPRFLGDD